MPPLMPGIGAEDVEPAVAVDDGGDHRRDSCLTACVPPHRNDGVITGSGLLDTIAEIERKHAPAFPREQPGNR